MLKIPRFFSSEMNETVKADLDSGTTVKNDAPIRQTGVISFNTMVDQNLNCADNQKYLYHGSNVLLEPGKDCLQPHNTWGAGLNSVVFSAPLNQALRFALVRTFGGNQVQSLDYYAYITDKYRLVLHGNLSGLNLTKNKLAYIYEVDASDFINARSTKAVPIISRSCVNRQILENAGFYIIPKNCEDSMQEYLKIDNDNDSIEKRVLPGLDYWQLLMMDKKLDELLK